MKTFLYLIRVVYIIQMVHPFCITSPRMWKRCWTWARTKDSGHEQGNCGDFNGRRALYKSARVWERSEPPGCPGESRTYALQTHRQGIIIKLDGAENWKLLHCLFSFVFFGFFFSFLAACSTMTRIQTVWLPENRLPAGLWYRRWKDRKLALILYSSAVGATREAY